MARRQGANARLDESLGMRNGAESKMSQSYSSRRNESRGMKGMGKDLRSATKATYKVDVPCGTGWSEVVERKEGNNGNPSQAYDYKY